MSLAACLLAYSMVVAVLGPPLLARATRSGAAPRAGMAVWAAAMASLLGSWALGAVLLAVDLVRSWVRSTGSSPGVSPHWQQRPPVDTGGSCRPSSRS